MSAFNANIGRLALLLASMAAPAHAVQEGQIDQGFPVSITVPDATAASAHAITLQADGKILLAGYSTRDTVSAVTVVRLLSNGSLDAGFGEDGIIRVTEPNSVNSLGGWVAALPDGRVMTAGSTTVGNAVGNGIVVMRLLPGGGLDTSFSVDGRTVIGLGQQLLCAPERIGCSAIASPDGGVTIAAVAGNPQTGVLRVYRLRPDGAPDSSFGTNGMVQFNTLPGQAGAAFIPYSPYLQQREDGRLVVMSGSVLDGGMETTVFQLRANGTLDTSFGTGGGVLLAEGASDYLVPAGLHLLRDGGVQLGIARLSQGTTTLASARLHANGSFDTGYGSSGVAAISPADSCVAFDCFAYAMQMDARDRAYVVGVIPDDSMPSPDQDIGIVRFTRQGQADTSYAPNGRRRYQRDVIGPPLTLLADEQPHATALDARGRLLMASSAHVTLPNNTRILGMQAWRIHTDVMFVNDFE